jgi:hypothetical protein
VSFEVPAGGVVVAGVVAAGVLAVEAGLVLEVELLLDEPQPASARAPTAQVKDDLRSLAFKAFASDCWVLVCDSRRSSRSPPYGDRVIVGIRERC